MRSPNTARTAWGWAAWCVLAAGLGSFVQGAETVAWDPLARPAAEADTLFLPDLSSPAAIEAGGGFLWGKHNENEDVDRLHQLYEFGAGRFGPAARVRATNVGNCWVWFPLDGLIPGDQFTIEFSARSDRPWSEESGSAFFRLDSRENEIAFRIQENELRVELRSPFSQSHWRASIEEAGLRGGRWHVFAVTLREGTLRVYLDGTQRGVIENVRFAPLWSDAAGGTEGIQLGGSPWHSTNIWLSDLRISRTARVPSEPVALRSLKSTLRVDTARPLGPIPPPFVGSLHPGQKEWPPEQHPGATPEQIRAALYVVRTDKFLQATPIKRGEPDQEHPSRGHSGRFSYDWQVADRTLDWFAAHGVKPYISINATPSILGGSVKPFEGEKLRTALSRSSGFRPEMPNDLEAWDAVVEDFVHHVLNEHKTEVPWWGVWNEPDQPGFWNGTVEDYLKLYEVTVRAVRKIDPHAKVGGPESGLHGPWIEALIRRCAERGLPLDFVSYHDYSGDLNTIELAREKVDRLAQAAGLNAPARLPIVVGEFNWSAGNLYKPGWPRFHRDFWHIRAFGAAYTTAWLTRAAEVPAVDLMIYSHTHYGDPRAGGWATTQLIGPQREQWAPYNALKGWKTVIGDRVLHAEKELAPGVFALATRESNTGAIGVVLANYGFAQRQARAVSLVLDNLPAGNWQLRRWSVDPAHSSRFDAEGDPFAATARDELEMVEQRELRADGVRPLVVELELPAWSSVFVELRP